MHNIRKVSNFIGKYRFEIGAFLIAVSCLVLKLIDLNIKPSWFIDEGSNLEIAWSLVHGHPQYLTYTYLFIPHFPLFFLASGIFLLFFGKSILVLRIFTTLCVFIASLSVFLIGKEIKNKKMGVLACLFFCFLYENMLFPRYALSANFSVLLLSFMALFSIKYIKTGRERWIYWAALMTSFLFFTEIYLWGIIVIFPYLLWNKKKTLFKCILISVGPIFVFFILMLFFVNPDFINDIKFYFLERVLNKHKPSFVLLLTFFTWISASIFNPLGIAGIFFIKNRKIKFLFLIAFFVVIVPLFLNEPGFFGRNRILNTFFVAIGLAFFIEKIYSLFQDSIICTLRLNKTFSYFFMVLITLVIFSGELQKDLQVTLSNSDPMLKEIDLTLENKARLDVAKFINQNTNPSDLVIASDDLAYLIKARTTNIFQVALFENIESDIYSPKFFDKKRFYFEIPLNKVKYYVENKYEINIWKKNINNIMSGLVEKAEAWPIEKEAEALVVHRNPSL
jgi:hypothetical protein